MANDDRAFQADAGAANMAAREAPVVAPGARIAGFRIVELIGQGGMGAVYKAIDETLDRAVALKLLTPRLSERPDALARFQQEARSASWVNHDNVVQIFSFGTDAGIPYIAMEHLRGETLGQRLERGPLNAADIADIVLPICSGLHAAHRKGILHRDLKPSNIFLARKATGEMPKVLDFGISKLDPQPGAAHLTDTGMVLGTQLYMAPEQALGNPLDPRTDEYSLGVVLYECLTGQTPHANKPQYRVFKDAAEGVFEIPSKRVPRVPKAFEAIVVRALQPAPDDRFADLRALGRALLPFASARAKSQWTEHYEAPDASLGTGLSAPRMAPAARDAGEPKRDIQDTVPTPRTELLGGGNQPWGGDTQQSGGTNVRGPDAADFTGADDATDTEREQTGAPTVSERAAINRVSGHPDERASASARERDAGVSADPAPTRVLAQLQHGGGADLPPTQTAIRPGASARAGKASAESRGANDTSRSTTPARRAVMIAAMICLLFGGALVFRGLRSRAPEQEAPTGALDKQPIMKTAIPESTHSSDPVVVPTTADAGATPGTDTKTTVAPNTESTSVAQPSVNEASVVPRSAAGTATPATAPAPASNASPEKSEPDNSKPPLHDKKDAGSGKHGKHGKDVFYTPEGVPVI